MTTTEKPTHVADTINPDRPSYATSVNLLPMPERITGDRFEPGQMTAVATPEGEYEVLVLIQVDADRIAVQAWEAIPEADVLKGEVFVTSILNTTRG